MRFSIKSLIHVITNPLVLIDEVIFVIWRFIQEKLIHLSTFLEQNYSWIFLSIKIIWILFVPLWYSLVFSNLVICYFFKKMQRFIMIFSLLYLRPYADDAVLDELLETDIRLKPKDIEKNNKILNDVVRCRIIDYMKIVDDDFNDLFLHIYNGGSFYKDLKINQPDEYDLYLMIDLSRSIDTELIKIEPDKNAVAYLKIKICQDEFEENEVFWHNLLDNDNYLNQNKFRDWIHNTLEKALTAFSGGRQLEGYVVKHHKNIYCINFRQNGPALTLTVIRKNNWRKIDVDLVPCLVFPNQILPGFRRHKAKKWIAVAKPLRNALIENRDILWQAGFQEDEKRILAEPIKPIIKLVKKVRDIKGWVHLKSYFIETLFMHELDDPVFRFFYSKISISDLFIYMLTQLQSKLEKRELLYYWHKGFNLLDRTNSLPLLETSKELKEMLEIIERNNGYEDECLLDIFDQNEDTTFNANLRDCDYICIVLAILLLCDLHRRNLNIPDINAYFTYQFESISNWTTTWK